ncbi:MAG: synthetase, partial [Pseudomonadota bacterium]
MLGIYNLIMKIAVAQLNLMVGALSQNAEKILQAAQSAVAAGAQMMLTSELSICGYPPEDLLLRPKFIGDCLTASARLAEQLPPELYVVLGLPTRSEQGLRNSLRVYHGGRIVAEYHKRELPNYAVFDEKRYFTSANAACVFECAGVKCGLLICEDMWLPTAAGASKAAGAELLLVANGSPYHTEQQSARRAQAGARVRETGLPLVYANCVGGQDELVFDGDSFALNAKGVEV